MSISPLCFSLHLKYGCFASLFSQEYFLFRQSNSFPSLCICLRRSAPWTVFWSSHVRRLAALLIQLRSSFSEICLIYSTFNIKLYVGRRERHHQVPSDSVHQAVQLYPVICHEEKNPSRFLTLNKAVWKHHNKRKREIKQRVMRETINSFSGKLGRKKKKDKTKKGKKSWWSRDGSKAAPDARRTTGGEHCNSAQTAWKGKKFLS